MTELFLQRGPVDTDSTPGTLQLNGEFFCYTLERLPDGSFPRIEAGRFALVRYLSPKRGFDVPLLRDVPGRSMIEIHPANWSYQLQGCIAVGKERDPDAVWDSRQAFNQLMGKIGEDLDAGECWITVRDAA